MSSPVLWSSLFNPQVLYFGLGLLAATVRSDLEVPAALATFFSSFLLMAIGLRGGAELVKAAASGSMWLTLGVAAAASALMPVYLYAIARRRMDVANAAALSAAYGSVSAVTFACALGLLQGLRIPYHEYLNVALAAMEAPAIITGALIYRIAQARSDAPAGTGTGPGVAAILRRVASKGSLLLLIGSLVIGASAGESGWATVKPLFGDQFKAILCFFLLDQGCRCGRQLGELRRAGGFAFGYALGMPLLGALAGLALSSLIALPAGDAFLLTTLCASASYLAVPAAMREAIPKANPGIYVTLPLAVTFPFNVVIGLPLYLAAAQALSGLPPGAT